MGKTRKAVRKSLDKRSIKAAIVITVFNEQDNIVDLVGSLWAQTLPPAEVVIVDGGSTDQTFSLLQKEAKKWSSLKVFQVKGNRSVGRNLGVAQTHTPIIVFTDAGCRPHPDWLEQLILPFLDTKVKVVSGYYEGLAKTSFEKSLVPYVLVMPDKAGKSEFFPSTRSMAMRRNVWDESGGFDVRLFHNEDYAYAHWLKKMGVIFTFAPKAIVSWFPRKNLSQAAWMFLRFAIGDAQSGIIRPKVRLIIIRYLVFTYLLFVALEYRPLFLLIIPLALLYMAWAVFKNYRYVKTAAGVFWLPVLQITSDLMVIAGTIMGSASKPNGVS